jgi:hypothetical protein
MCVSINHRLVLKKVLRVGDAKYNCYYGRTRNRERGGVAKAASTPPVHVVHVVGPDFRIGSPPRADAVEMLARTYANVLSEFVAVKQQHRTVRTLRLLPISGGVFSGMHGAFV